jgi:nucleoside-diphosphate-sugar epimerase
MTRVLVTGGSGFIGRHVLPALVERGSEVHACSRAVRASSPGVTWHRADALDVAGMSALVDRIRPEVLLHLAWFVTPPDYVRSTRNLGWAAATLALAEAFACAGGRRLVCAGTCFEYGWPQHASVAAGVGESRCVEGLTPIAPSTVYGGCKAAVWSALEPFAREVGLSAAWSRLFFLFGPHEPPSRLLPSIVTAIQAGTPAQCRTARHVRDFLHVADAGDALAALALSAVEGPVNIASGEPVPVGVIAEGIARRLERPDLLRMEEGPAKDAFVVASVARLRDEVRWRPAYTLESGLDDAVAWWAEHATPGAVGGRRT